MLAFGIIAICVIALLCILQFGSQWYLSRDIDCIEGGGFPKRWLCWGTCRAIGGLGPDFRYFVLRLPSYESMLDYANRWRWFQRAVLCFNGNWTMIYVS